jgi:hypothetical protein
VVEICRACRKHLQDFVHSWSGSSVACLLCYYSESKLQVYQCIRSGRRVNADYSQPFTPFSLYPYFASLFGVAYESSQTYALGRLVFIWSVFISLLEVPSYYSPLLCLFFHNSSPVIARFTRLHQGLTPLSLSGFFANNILEIFPLISHSAHTLL